jgi:hypothetical protein
VALAPALWLPEKKAQRWEQEARGYTHSIGVRRSGILEDIHEQQAQCLAEQPWALVSVPQRAENEQQR